MVQLTTYQYQSNDEICSFDGTVVPVVKTLHTRIYGSIEHELFCSLAPITHSVTPNRFYDPDAKYKERSLSSVKPMAAANVDDNTRYRYHITQLTFFKLLCW